MNLTESLRPETPDAPENTPDDPRVILALEEYLTALRTGQQPDRQAFAACHPDIAGPLAECLDALEFVHGAAPELGLPGVNRPPAASLSSTEIQPSASLGDFRILREIGRGGMGVVYEAEQISLGRSVALKVLPFAAALDAKQLQRFKNEAQAAAHLHHQNIVPVYGVGCERGVHYYAMQFIDGQTLADLIRQLRALASLSDAESLPTGPYAPPRETTGETASAVAETIPHPATYSTEHLATNPNFFRTAAQMGMQAAEALEHAHQLGVVHRDIKPGNLLVDGRGNLWITDFGLAHFRSEGNLTMTGDLLGTIRYMSPEQALAQSLDHRTDIYSLGATLYELLTLQPAFGGNDRQALLRQVVQEEPRSPRRLNKAVPPELETIVLKAMEKNAAERYATARELADDLRRFLEDRPILAKRPTLLHKARKLARRNKGVVRTILLALAVLLATVAVATTLAALRLDKEQTATLKQLDLTREAEAKATGRLYRSLVEQARASRLSRRMGQRFDSLNALAEAVKMARAMKLPEEDFRELRSEAIACLALPDLRIVKEWDGWPTGSIKADFDGAQERYVRLDRQGVVSIRRVADDTEIYRLSGFGPADYGPGETGACFSPDGQFLVLARADQIKVWKLAGQEPVLILEKPHPHTVFSPNSRQLVLGHADGSIHLYDLSSGRQLQQLKAGPAIRALAFHPKNQHLAISHAAGVRIRDLETGDVLADLPQPTGAYHIAWHPDGNTLAVGGGDRIIYLWDVVRHKPFVRLEGHKSDGVSFTFNGAGDVLGSTCWDGIMRLWDTRTGQQLFSIPSWGCFRFNQRDRLQAGSTEGTKLKLSEFTVGRGYRTLLREQVPGQQAGYGVCATSPKDRLLAVEMADGVGLWDLTNGTALAFLKLGRQSQ